MANKVRFKKYLLCSFIATMMLLIICIILNMYEYQIYRNNTNQKLDSIIKKVVEKYPEVSKNEIMDILNEKEKDNGNVNENVLKEYGIDIEKEAIVLENDKKHSYFSVINVLYLLFSIVIMSVIFLAYNRKKDKEISEITKCIEEINKKNYTLNIDDMSEDELSILKNEIYKTTIMLKEIADNSLKDKKDLKKSMEDISHQLKTPLTSILVMLDNLIDDEDMDKDIRVEFMRDIKRDVVNINFLVQSILKLSKFDANTIHFIKEDKLVKDIVENSKKNVSALCDLRNISIDVAGDDSASIVCDFRWQVEAITNILKNCIEHSKDNDKIVVRYEKNNVYSSICIRDYGEGISREDLPHIFDRFYRGKNSSPDSIGIGLSLAKTIIEEEKGSISIDSDENGTKFTIKYYYI